MKHQKAEADKGFAFCFVENRPKSETFGYFCETTKRKRNTKPSLHHKS